MNAGCGDCDVMRDAALEGGNRERQDARCGRDTDAHATSVVPAFRIASGFSIPPASRILSFPIPAPNPVFGIGSKYRIPNPNSFLLACSHAPD
jgi:hypothetical protein